MSLVELHGLAMNWPMAHTLHVAGRVLPETQKAFAGHIAANNGFPLLVYESTLDHLYYFLASFDHSVARERQNLPVEDAHGARMVNALAALNEGW